MAEAKKLTGVVVGATGAVGRELVAQLVASPRWARVVTIGRRALDPAPPEPTPGKLQQVVIDMDNLETDPAVQTALASGVDSVFCALGTTRGAAGSAEAFRRVDFDYVAATARAAAAAKVPHFGLVSAQGANPRMWSSNLAPFHVLLYTKTKGQAEEVVKSQGFAHVTIMRPGMLERGELTRGLERFFSHVTPTIPTSGVAAVLIRDAERFHGQQGAGGGGQAGEPVRVYEMKEMQRAAKEL